MTALVKYEYYINAQGKVEYIKINQTMPRDLAITSEDINNLLSLFNGFNAASKNTKHVPVLVKDRIGFVKGVDGVMLPKPATSDKDVYQLLLNNKES